MYRNACVAYTVLLILTEKMSSTLKRFLQSIFLETLMKGVSLQQRFRAGSRQLAVTKMFKYKDRNQPWRKK